MMASIVRRGVCLPKDMLQQRKLVMSTERMVSTVVAEHALGADSTYPPLDTDVLRLYSTRFCPFVHRTKLVLNHKAIPHEIVNMNLSERPAWFIAKAPLGLVPVLEQNGRIVYGSEVCNDYLDQVYPQNRLNSQDPFEFATQRMHREAIDKVVYSLYRIKDAKTVEDGAEVLRKMQLHLKYYDDLLAKGNGDFLLGDDVSMVDYYIWPWFERFPVLSAMFPCDPLGPFPHLQKWAEGMKQVPAVIATQMSPELHAGYFASFVAGAPNQDYGLSVAAKL